MITPPDNNTRLRYEEALITNFKSITPNGLNQTN